MLDNTLRARRMTRRTYPSIFKSLNVALLLHQHHTWGSLLSDSIWKYLYLALATFKAG
jgi:hypothetical protein